jgi:nicotinate-nucleotide adenylyltransferase
MNTERTFTGLFFGSFNPVHNGHLMIASYLLQHTPLEELWFVLSPHNPHKQKAGLLDHWLRLKMLEMATDVYPGLKVCDIELYLRQPSYTVITLAHLEQRYPERRFALIMGSDNLASLHKWFNAEVIISNYPLFVYPRPGSEKVEPPEGADVTMTEAPMVEISSSFIRNGIRRGDDMRFFLPDKVYRYILREQFYHTRI